MKKNAGISKYTMAVDIGTTKIAIMVGRETPQGKSIVFQYAVRSQGVHNGIIQNTNAAVNSVKNCLKVVKKQIDDAGFDFDAMRKVNVGIAGSHIQSFQLQHTCVRPNRKPIRAKEIEKMTSDVKAMALKAGRQLLHVIPQAYQVDSNYVGSRSVVGSTGAFIGGNYHVITADAEVIERITNCLTECGLQAGQIILEPLASAFVALSDDDMHIGTALVDIGGGTSDMVIYKNSEIVSTEMLPYGGGYITDEIAKACYLTPVQAEMLKVKYGACYCTPAMKNRNWTYPAADGAPPRNIGMERLADIIRAMMKDIVDVIKYNIYKCGCEISRIVLTGGGAELPFAAQFTAEQTGCEVRIGRPEIRIGDTNDKINSRYAVGVGLAFAGSQIQVQPKKTGIVVWKDDLFSGIKDWVYKNFWEEDYDVVEQNAE